MRPQLVLVHSPLMGPSVWWPLAGALSLAGREVLVPTLDDEEGGEPDLPWWRRHAHAVAAALSPDPFALIAHDAAGPLLPAIAREAGRAPTAYVFVDADLPADGTNRLELLAGEDPERAEQLRAHLEGGGRFPQWTATDLQAEIPDPAWCSRVVSEQRPRPLAFFSEPIPVQPGWPDAGGAYLRLSPRYDPQARRAHELGWAGEHLDGGHFHMLTEPDLVTGAILRLTDQAAGERADTSVNEI